MKEGTLEEMARDACGCVVCGNTNLYRERCEADALEAFARAYANQRLREAAARVGNSSGHFGCAGSAKQTVLSLIEGEQ